MLFSCFSVLLESSRPSAPRRFGASFSSATRKLGAAAVLLAEDSTSTTTGSLAAASALAEVCSQTTFGKIISCLRAPSPVFHWDLLASTYSSHQLLFQRTYSSDTAVPSTNVAPPASAISLPRPHPRACVSVRFRYCPTFSTSRLGDSRVFSGYLCL